MSLTVTSHVMHFIIIIIIIIIIHRLLDYSKNTDNQRHGKTLLLLYYYYYYWLLLLIIITVHEKALPASLRVQKVNISFSLCGSVKQSSHVLRPNWNAVQWLRVFGSSGVVGSLWNRYDISRKSPEVSVRHSPKMVRKERALALINKIIIIIT